MFISKRKNGFYYLFLKDENTGKRKMLSCKTKKKSEAINFVVNFKIKSQNTVGVKPVVTYYLEDLKKEVLQYTSDNLQKSTVQIYKRVFNNMIRILNNVSIALISNRDIENYKSLRISEVSKTTVNIDLKTMKAIFNIALRWKWIDENPLWYAKQFRIPQKEKLSFSENQLKFLIDNIENTKLKNIVLFASYTGCRLNEILNVQWKDINLNDNILTIRNKENFKTKSGKFRHIPISDNLYSLLKKIQIMSMENKVYLHSPDKYLFLSDKRNILTIDFVSRKFKLELKKFNYPDKFHFNCLRHTFITNLIKAGVNINYVKEIAGHSEIQTTMNYIHIVTDDLREAVNKINIFI
jgi:integrase